MPAVDALSEFVTSAYPKELTTGALLAYVVDQTLSWGVEAVPIWQSGGMREVNFIGCLSLFRDLEHKFCANKQLRDLYC